MIAPNFVGVLWCARAHALADSALGRPDAKFTIGRGVRFQ